MHPAEPAQEMLQCFDEQGNPTEARSRAEIGEKSHRFWCGVSNIWLVNDRGQLLCSKRSEALSGNPGKWQTYFGGHVPAGMTFRQNAVKELKEEIGLSVDEQDLFLVSKGRDDKNKKFFESCASRFNGMPTDLNFTDGEVTEAKWMDMDEYWKEREENPEVWCNSCKPEQQKAIRERIG